MNAREQANWSHGRRVHCIHFPPAVPQLPNHNVNAKPPHPLLHDSVFPSRGDKQHLREDRSSVDIVSTQWSGWHPDSTTPHRKAHFEGRAYRLMSGPGETRMELRVNENGVCKVGNNQSIHTPCKVRYRFQLQIQTVHDILVFISLPR